MTRRARRILPMIALLAAIFTLPATASATERYTIKDFNRCDGSQNGGSYDRAGRLFMACDQTKVLIKARGATTFAEVAIEGNVRDVAPNPTGNLVYAVNGNFLHRFKRDGGTFKIDRAWGLDRFTYGGVATPADAVTSVTTDAHGSIYVTLNKYQTVAKYDATGKLLTQFGSWGNQGVPGTFILPMGIATTRDGRTVYVVDKSGHRVHRFEYRQMDGSYRAVNTFGRLAKDAAGQITCAPADALAAPGDVAVDAWGFVYVMDTTCAKFRKYTAEGAPLGAWSGGPGRDHRSHKFGVDIDGNGYAAEVMNNSFQRATPTPTDQLPAVAPLPEPPFTRSARNMCPNEPWVNGAGQAANDGTVYIACAGSIYVANSDGTQVGRIALPAGSHYYDVAPSPDERYLYVTRVVDPAGAGAKSSLPHVIRLERTGLTAYRLSTAAEWGGLKAFDFGGARTPCGRYVQTDAWGDIYFINGSWCGTFRDAFDQNFEGVASPNLVVKFRPDGTPIMRFGTGPMMADELEGAMGLGVSRDGRTIAVVESKAHRVQRFHINEQSGRYEQTVAPARFGRFDNTCTAADAMWVPYDVGVDPWGTIWIANTGCQSVDWYSADGAAQGRLPVGGLAHGLAVDHTGGVWLGELSTMVRRSASNPVPGPLPALVPLPEPPVEDTQDPVLLTVTVPESTATRDIVIRTTWRDDVGVTQIRVANEDGNWGAWQAYRADLPHRLSASAVAYKGVSVQVRDASGRESASVYKAITYTGG